MQSKAFRGVSASLFIATLTACGGGGGSSALPSTSTSLTVTGTAATGLAIAGATVSGKCKLGTGNATTLANGSFTLTVTGGQLPCILQVINPADGTKLHTVVSGADSTALANITPLTEMTTARVLGSEPNVFFAAFDAAVATQKVTTANIASAQTAIGLVFTGTFDTTGIANFITTPLVAATQGSPTSGDAQDKLLDALKLKLTTAQLGTVTTALANNQTADTIKQIVINLTVAPTTPPVANAGAAQSVVVGSTVTLDASTSSAAAGKTLTYAWTLTSKPAGSFAAFAASTTVKPTFVADVAGSYVASVVVNDGTTVSSASAVTVTASVANAAPVANAGVAQNVVVGSVVTLNGIGSSDANGDTLTYAWALTEKPAGSAAALSSATSDKPTLTTDLAGTYVATLIVNDGQVNSSAVSVAISVKPPSPITKLSAGLNHTYALQADGTLWAWGENLFSQIGDGTTTNRLTPVKINGIFQDVTAGAGNAVAIKGDGSVWTWGRDDYGQQGNGPLSGSVSTPTAVGTGYAKVYSGYFHAYGVKANGVLWGWGENGYGQIGDGTTINRTAPSESIFGSDFVSIAGGILANYGIKSDGTLWAWGSNIYGQLGDGTNINRQFPVLVGSNFVLVVAGDLSVIGIKNDGTLWAWGNNSGGQLGDGTRISRNTPIQIGTGFVSASSGGYGSNVSRTTDNFGNTTTTYSAGGAHTLAVKNDGSLWAWGENSYGQLGDGTTIQRLSPVKIGDGFRTAVAGGYADNSHSAAIKTDGSVWAWGGNLKGQVGDGTTTMRLSPVRIFFTSN